MHNFVLQFTIYGVVNGGSVSPHDPPLYIH